MVAVEPSIRSVLAHPNAKLLCANERAPFVGLDSRASKSGREDDTTDGVSVTICSVGIELSSCIASRNVDLGQVSNTGNLDKVRGLNEMDSGQGAIRDETGPVTSLSAPCDLKSLCLADGRVSSGLRGGPKTKVIDELT